MDCLPLEVSFIIFYYLKFSEKLDLALTNKYWYTLIHDNVLYDHLAYQVPRSWGPERPNVKSRVIMPKLYKSELHIKKQVVKFSNLTNLALMGDDNTEPTLEYLPNLEYFILIGFEQVIKITK
ncbi:hypothetical protein BD770DRAFT_412233 [Pilaira anomala]|nr:hypothetical protein BD770DRAFT_412233 [Pilaira anomala]